MPMKAEEFRSGVIGKIKQRFEIHERSAGHIVYEIWHNNQKILRTHQSHGSGGRDISDNILGKIKRQLLLDTLSQIYALKDCPMTAEAYYQLLKSKNVISN